MRSAIVALAFGAGLGLLAILGVSAVFTVQYMVAPFVVFLALLAMAVFLYRPFCRALCPYGALLALVARHARYKLRRTENCIECGRCERACPTNKAYVNTFKSECYLCERCRSECPVDAIEYTRR